MAKINDLNLKNWKENTVKLYGDRYKTRKTIDINDFLGMEIYGYEVYDKRGDYLFYYQTDNEKDLMRYLKYKIYREFI